MIVLARAAIAYAAMAFVAGFAFGVVRTLVVEPRVGPVAAVLIETPLMLAICWIACAWTMRRFRISASIAQRALVGAIALVMLLVLECALGFVSGRSPAGIAAGLASAPGRIGLAAQVAFALLPMVQSKITPRD